MEKKMNSTAMLLELNKIVDKMDRDSAKNNPELLAKIAEKNDNFIKSLETNWLWLDTAPGSQLASKICTDDAFYDMTCANDYLLSVLFGDGYRGVNMTPTTLVKAFTKKAKLLYTKKGCDLWSITKDAKKIAIKQFQIGGKCEIDFEMFIGGTSRANAIKNIISMIFDEAVSNTFEDILINGDVLNTTANINGLSAPVTGDILPQFLASDGLKKHALKGYWKVDDSDNSVWTPYTAADLLNTTLDFTSSFSLAQIQALINKIWCCGNELLIMNCQTYGAMLMLAQNLGGTSIVDVDASQYKQTGKLKTLFGYTIYISDNVEMVKADGTTSLVATENDRNYILAVNPKAVLRGFGTDIINWVDEKLGCETLYTRASMWFGICTNPTKPNVAIGLNIKI